MPINSDFIEFEDEEEDIIIKAKVLAI